MRVLKLAVGTAAVVGLIAVPVTLASGGGDTTPRAVHPARTTRPARAPRLRPEHVYRRRRIRRVSRSVRGSSTVTIYLREPVRTIPRSYLGLSIEYWGLPRFERVLTPFTRLLSLLQVAGGGPLTLRVGGDSADRSLWDPSGGRLPPWVFRLGPSWLHLTDLMLAVAPVRLILDLNLVTASPLRSAAWARAAEQALPPGRISAFEVGNEPDLYNRPYWRTVISHVGPRAAVLPAAISARSYVRVFAVYARALARFAPGVPLIGPAVAEPQRSLGWIAALVRNSRRRLGGLSAHRYPYSACVPRDSPAFPTVARLLSERATAGAASTLRPAVALAHRAGLPFRMTELNSVTCGGRAGVSNTFATALWAPDALFELMRAGVDGVNVHVRTDTVNAAMVPASGGLASRPLLYGLILFTRTLSAGGRLLGVGLHAPAGVHLKVWAVRTAAGGTRALLINKGHRTALADLEIPGSTPATVQRLLAPSASATGGETLDGQALGRDGAWRGTLRLGTVVPGIRGYVTEVPGMSAALISIR